MYKYYVFSSKDGIKRIVNRIKKKKQFTISRVSNKCVIFSSNVLSECLNYILSICGTDVLLHVKYIDGCIVTRYVKNTGSKNFNKVGISVLDSMNDDIGDYEDVAEYERRTRSYNI